MSRNRPKRFGMLVFVLTVFILVSLVSICSAAEVKKVTYRLGHAVAENPEHPYTVAAKTFARLLKEKSNGAIEVNIFPGSQLGTEGAMIEGLRFNTLDMAVMSGAEMSRYTPIQAALDLPWLYDGDIDRAYKVLESDTGKQLLKELCAAVGVKGLTFCYQPFRHFLTNKPINGIEDMKGLKLRTMPSAVHVEVFRAVGCSPTPVPFGELYQSLKTGIVDGAESDVIGTWVMKFNEVTKYLTISNHFNNTFTIIMNNKLFNSLSAKEQEIFQRAADEAAIATIEITKATTDKYLGKLKDAGQIVNDRLDLRPFKKAAEPVYQNWMAKDPIIRKFVEAARATK